MKHFALRYGAIAGLSIILTSTIAIHASKAFPESLGYLVMIVALSLIFLGIKQYRDRDLGGVIRFGSATLLGVGITLVSSIIYVLGWEIYLSFTDYVFIDEYAQSVIAAKEAAGVSADALQATVESMNKFKKQYASPFFRLPMTFLEIFPVGLIISLISAALLRNSDILAADVE